MGDLFRSGRVPGGHEIGNQRLRPANAAPRRPGPGPSNRHLVITGASSGIGAALAHAYAGPGLALSLLGRNEERLQAVAAACRERGAVVTIGIADVTDAAAMRDWLIARDDALPVDVLVANAGVGGSDAVAGARNPDHEADRAMLSVNTIGVLNTVGPLLPRFLDRGRGRIGMVSSMAGFIGLPDSPAYCASKAAVTMYGEALRRQVAPHGVGVTIVCPGFVDTPMSRSLPGGRMFVWTAEAAARRIKRGLDRGERLVRFPGVFTLGVKLARLLPAPLIDSVLIRTRIGDRA